MVHGHSTHSNAFATSTSVLGGNNGDNSLTLEQKLAFCVFSISSLIALCSSLTLWSCFSPLSPPAGAKGVFSTGLAKNFCLGSHLSLNTYIEALLITSWAAHFLVLTNKLKIFSAFQIWFKIMVLVIDSEHFEAHQSWSHRIIHKSTAPPVLREGIEIECVVASLSHFSVPH